MGGHIGVSKKIKLLKNCLPSFKWVGFGHLNSKYFSKL